MTTNILPIDEVTGNLICPFCLADAGTVFEAQQCKHARVEGEDHYERVIFGFYCSAGRLGDEHHHWEVEFNLGPIRLGAMSVRVSEIMPCPGEEDCPYVYKHWDHPDNVSQFQYSYDEETKTFTVEGPISKYLKY